MESVELKKVEEPKAEEKKAEEPVEVGSGGVVIKKCLILADEYEELISFRRRALKKGKNRKLDKKDKEAIAQRVALFTFDERKFAEYHVEAAIARMMEIDAERAQKKFDQMQAEKAAEGKGKEEENPLVKSVAEAAIAE